MRKSVSIFIISSFLLGIFIGAVLLMLPFSTAHGSISPEDALFTSASAVTVTGLIVVDTATYFTTFGQVIILLLLQIGGLGFMTFSTFGILIMGKPYSLKDKSIIENDFTSGSYKNVKELVVKIITVTFSLELIGAIVLYFQFGHLKGTHRVFSAVFHSISAFCNAGFSIFSNSFENYKGDWGINATLMVLIILGGIGFLVLNEIGLFIRRKITRVSRFSLHSKLVFVSSGILILVGFVVLFIEEQVNPSNSLSTGATALTALFQSVTARTAGFNTVNLGLLSHASIFILLLFMFIGASPGSTGGGIKTTSVSVVFGYFRSILRGRDKIDLFYRSIPDKTIEKALIVIIISFLMISFFSLLLLTFEPEQSFDKLLFETVSAFGTVGLSMGVTSQLSIPSKLIVSLTMFIGRIGPLTLLIALGKRESRAIMKYPEEQIMIG
jgi:trk system potassium uptake protein TrkH